MTLHAVPDALPPREPPTREYAEAVVAFWAEHKFGISWTAANEGTLGKTCRVTSPTHDWNATAVNGDLGAAVDDFLQKITTRNPVIVAKPADPNARALILVEADGEDELAAYQEYDAPKTLTAQSSSPDKLHFYFRPPEGATKHRIRFEAGTIHTDKNGYFVAPPARHPTGKLYKYLDRSVPVAELPPAVYAKMIEDAGRQDTEAREALRENADEKITAGSRHARMLGLAGALRRHGVVEEGALRLLLEFNAARCDPPKSPRQVTGMVKDVYERYGPADPDDLLFEDYEPMKPKPTTKIPKLNEDRFADHFIERHGNDFRYVAKLGKWFVYENGKWSEDTKDVRSLEAVVRLKRAVAKEVRQHPNYSQLDDDEKTAYAKFSAERGYKGFCSNVLTIAQARALLPLQRLDAQPWKLVVGNGTLNLKTCTLEKWNPLDLLTTGTSVNYIEGAPAPQFKQFMSEITCGDKDLSRYLRRLFGLCLTGSVDQQKLWIFLGAGGNGKSTLINVIARTLEDDSLTAAIDFSTVTAQKFTRDGSAPSPDIARLRAARMAYAIEGEKKRALNDQRIKKVTGKDTMTARFLNENTFEFVPQFKLFLVVNDKPSMSTTDKAVKRRVVMVPFNAEFEGAARKLEMEDLLLTERTGVLAWMVRGLRDYNANGLGMCDAIRDATADYVESMNPLRAYADAHLEIGNGYEFISSRDFYDSIRDFLEAANEEPMGDHLITQALEALGGKKTRTHRDGEKQTIWKGFRLRAATTL